MSHLSRMSAIVGTLCLVAACSDSAVPTSPVQPNGFAAEVASVDCTTELDALRAAIAAATFEGKKASDERTNLSLKVDEAAAKVAEDKLDGAVQKLEDIRAAVLVLSAPDAKGKIKLTAGAEDILAAVSAAEACIEPPTITAA